MWFAPGKNNLTPDCVWLTTCSETLRMSHSISAPRQTGGLVHTGPPSFRELPFLGFSPSIYLVEKELLFCLSAKIQTLAKAQSSPESKLITGDRGMGMASALTHSQDVQPCCRIGASCYETSDGILDTISGYIDSGRNCIRTEKSTRNLTKDLLLSRSMEQFTSVPEPPRRASPVSRFLSGLFTETIVTKRQNQYVHTESITNIIAKARSELPTDRTS